MSKSILDDIIDSSNGNGNGRAIAKRPAAVEVASRPEAGLVAPGRLTTAQLLVTVQQLGNQVDRAVEAFQKLPSATPQEVVKILEDLQEAAAAIQNKALRLQTANN